MLLQSNMVKRITASGGGDLEAKTGESLRVKRIECIPSANDDYLTISVDMVTLAYYRVKGKSGNQLGTLHDMFQKGNIMEFLNEQGINVTIPIAEGQTLNVSRYAEAGDVVLIYDRYSGGDVKETDLNGSASKVYTFLQYAKVGTAPVATGDNHIDTALTPALFPDFPCGKVVPALHTIDLLGIAASPFNNGTGMGARFVTNYLKLIRNREVLLDTDRKGIPFEGVDTDQSDNLYKAAFSLIGSGAEVLLDEEFAGDVLQTPSITPGKPLMFDPALKFIAGEELSAYLTVTKTGAATWTDGVDDLAFILRVHRI